MPDRAVVSPAVGVLTRRWWARTPVDIGMAISVGCALSYLIVMLVVVKVYISVLVISIILVILYIVGYNRRRQDPNPSSPMHHSIGAVGMIVLA